LYEAIEGLRAMKRIGNPHLHGALTAIPGMAHLHGTGPAGTHCNACAFVDPESRRRTKADGLCRKCQKFAALMRFVGPSFPLLSDSCRYFEPAAKQKVTTEDFRRGR
jgi:hypothetical protein